MVTTLSVLPSKDAYEKMSVIHNHGPYMYILPEDTYSPNVAIINDRFVISLRKEGGSGEVAYAFLDLDKWSGCYFGINGMNLIAEGETNRLYPSVYGSRYAEIHVKDDEVFFELPNRAEILFTLSIGAFRYIIENVNEDCREW